MTSDATPKPPRRRDRKASEAALIEAGVEIFASEGYDAATTRAIAARAGLNEQLLTRYFGGKAGLLVAIYEDFLRGQADVQAYSDAAPGKDAYEEIEQFLLAKHAHYRDTQRLVSIFVPRLLLDREAREGIDTALLERATRILADRLIALQGRGSIRAGVDVVQLSHSIAYQSIGVSFLSRIIRGISDDEAISQLRQFAHAISHGIAC